MPTHAHCPSRLVLRARSVAVFYSCKTLPHSVLSSSYFELGRRLRRYHASNSICPLWSNLGASSGAGTCVLVTAPCGSQSTRYKPPALGFDLCCHHAHLFPFMSTIQ